MNNKQKSGFTLVEFIVAIFLLSMVVLTAVTLELSMRRLQLRPEVKVRLLNELTPVVERIRKDFQGQLGNIFDPSRSIEDIGRKVVIRVDSDNDGVPDQWHAYKWNGVAGGSVEYSPINFTASPGHEVLAQGITYFNAEAPTIYNNTALRLTIRTKKNPSAPEHTINNPGVNLTTTIYSRMTSGR